MTQQEFNQQHLTGEQLTMDPVTFGMLSNIDNL